MVELQNNLHDGKDPIRVKLSVVINEGAGKMYNARIRRNMSMRHNIKNNNTWDLYGYCGTTSDGRQTCRCQGSGACLPGCCGGREDHRHVAK